MTTQQCPACGEWIDDTGTLDFCPTCGEAITPDDGPH
jgi:predicted RNA-binding Zn-ribbon protein involved in translation (DUF1610 family)